MYVFHRDMFDSADCRSIIDTRATVEDQLGVFIHTHYLDQGSSAIIINRRENSKDASPGFMLEIQIKHLDCQT